MSAAYFRLQQLISPSLPIGAFTYSQGMEWAVESGWIKDAESLYAWLDSVLSGTMVTMELPLLMRIADCIEYKDAQGCHDWSAYLLSCRETSELRAEEQQRGQAFSALLDKLPEAAVWPELSDPVWRGAMDISQLSGFALACHKWNISREDMLRGYLWSWLENMVIGAVKLIPLGQSDGQRVLFRFTDYLSTACEEAFDVEDDDIGASSPAQAIASSLHETQYCRLFRS
ncbi:urease accessory protein [Thalassolituus maritimus]|uniref:Urease accessory protein UreF n=1 Tax=Thalassolituus maritimus TaxID=484498 RepID=A0A1N7KD05_9GAMM|nr:urease accessory protein UreF [Thalassolituus maritimus]SIS59429.1 urease accessory protein [Thalassolituus maritimus]